ncbi:putative polypeptide N-acetylgalactosaminyltransferase 10 [Onthophagus taurus]|uniref:putative polypeptide N-acetylgalactosaminyltransferase 10 n=1 Tax=Onthophagus taurus TaxID=166361 RepID=UPI000C20A3F4|nr:putative polypeptide N-acetylgalactosaminyltransferase 10 [Onthophagus taurus]XP_022920152.1 putative polypeptide N-acetylgalactosaminyltransferase 10 [Onthophagus taurus]
MVMIKRNLRSMLKFAFISFATVIFTVLIYRTIRGHKSIKYVDVVPAPQALIESKFPFPPLISNEKIDWHNYDLIEKDKKRTGIGEQGKEVKNPQNIPNYDKLFKVNGFNAALSDQIALDRAIPDIRHKGCKKKKYLKELPTVSVIVPFHNEHWTTLLRTVHSVLNRSPHNLLKEIILVDDFSSKEFSKKPLDDYLLVNATKTRVIHLSERSGLIRARLAGAKEAVGDVLVFLDSHTEANVNWLPPLLEPIAQNYKTCVCPFIDVVQYETFEYRAQDEGARGAFDWELYYKRLPLRPEDLERPTEPFESPVMAGGLFAISQKFFWELGGYDEGLDIWGGEQYELSFKIWMCGGQMYDAPCSRVGHIYRKYAPFPNPGKGDFVGRNYKRVAEVWMDEYAEFIYKRRPHYRKLDPGDLTKEKAIRDRLKCKTFKWFMETIAFDLPLKYPPIEPDDFASGEIRNIAAPDLCVDAYYKQRDQPFGLRDCIKGTSKEGEQNFTLTWHKDIRMKGKTLCWDVSDPNDKAQIVLYPCHGGKGNQYWRYDVDKQWLVHGGNPRCLDCDPGTKKIYVTKCDTGSKTQRWRFENVDLKLMEKWEDIGPA